MAKGMAMLGKAMRFLYNDTYRTSLEAKLDALDKQTVEGATTDAKEVIEAMKTKKEAFRTAMVSHDTATLHTMMRDAKPELERLRADRKTILDVFAKYRTTAPAPVATGTSPAMIYPNPVRAGSAAARIQYHLKAAGTVRIVITDQQGQVVRELAMNGESAGDHTVEIGDALKGVGTYVVTIEADGTRRVEKVAVVE